MDKLHKSNGDSLAIAHADNTLDSAAWEISSTWMLIAPQFSL